ADGDLIKIGSFTFQFSTGRKREDRLSGGWGGRKPPEIAAGALQIGDKTVALDQRLLLIGRRTGSEILLSGDAVSTSHAVVFQMDGKRHVRDLGSRTATFLNGKPIHQEPLSPGDRLTIGGVNLIYTQRGTAPAVVEQPVEEPVADAMSAEAVAESVLELDKVDRLPLAPEELIEAEKSKETVAP